MLLTTYKYAHFLLLPRGGGLHLVLHDKADARDMVQVRAPIFEEGVVYCGGWAGGWARGGGCTTSQTRGTWRRVRT